MHSNHKPKPAVSQVAPSKNYGAALLDAKKQHAGNVCTGTFLRPHAPYIKEIIDRLGVKTILDYGCGKGIQYDWVLPDYRDHLPHWQGCANKTLEQWWGVEVTKFDPAYPPFAQEPKGQFDMVLCTHTLGMIPITDHAWVIDRLYGHARKSLYIAERMEPPRKVVGDPTLRPANMGWTITDWQAHVSRPGSAIEVRLCCRHRDGDAKIQLASDWNGAAWTPVRQMLSGSGWGEWE